MPAGNDIHRMSLSSNGLEIIPVMLTLTPPPDAAQRMHLEQTSSTGVIFFVEFPTLNRLARGDNKTTKVQFCLPFPPGSSKLPSYTFQCIRRRMECSHKSLCKAAMRIFSLIFFECWISREVKRIHLNGQLIMQFNSMVLQPSLS